MNDRSELIMNYKTVVGNIISWFFAILFFAIGLVNICWGNDPLFGVFIAVLSFMYLPPVNMQIRKIIGFSIPLILKILVGLFIIWAAVGVGELFDKVDMMRQDL